MTQCWQHQPEDRPNFATILERIEYCTQVLVSIRLKWVGWRGFLRSGLGKPEHEMRRQHRITAVSIPARLTSACDQWLGYLPHRWLILLVFHCWKAQAYTNLHSFTNSRPVALLLLIKAQIPTSKRAKARQRPYALHVLYVSHSIPVFTLKMWSALSRNGPAQSTLCRWLLQLSAIFWIWLCWRRQVETAMLKEWGF